VPSRSAAAGHRRLQIATDEMSVSVGMSGWPAEPGPVTTAGDWFSELRGRAFSATSRSNGAAARLNP